MRKRWYDSVREENPILIASHVRLARNLVKYPFSMKLDGQESQALVDEVKEGLWAAGIFDDGTCSFRELSQLDAMTKKALAERHTITPLFRDRLVPAALMMRSDESGCVMVNEEDHICIQTAALGDTLESVYRAADDLDNRLSEHMTYAYNHKYGYITSCPTHMGTGLSASYVMHLPFMEREKLIKPLADELFRLGFSLRAIYSEGMASCGSMYRLSNQKTLGMSEEDILISLKNMMLQVSDHERGARDRILRRHRLEIEDMVYRSFGILKYGQVFTANDAMNHLSNIRFGLDAQILKTEEAGSDIFSLMINILPANLMEQTGKTLGSVQRHQCRAGYIHEHLPEIRR